MTTAIFINKFKCRVYKWQTDRDNEEIIIIHLKDQIISDAENVDTWDESVEANSDVEHNMKLVKPRNMTWNIKLVIILLSISIKGEKTWICIFNLIKVSTNI